jgi:hypothetical protein
VYKKNELRKHLMCDVVIKRKRDMTEEASDSDTIPDRRENYCCWNTEQEVTTEEGKEDQDREAGDKRGSI